MILDHLKDFFTSLESILIRLTSLSVFCSLPEYLVLDFISSKLPYHQASADGVHLVRRLPVARSLFTNLFSKMKKEDEADPENPKKDDD